MRLVASEHAAATEVATAAAAAEMELRAADITFYETRAARDCSIRERADAIANGIIADPDRPRALSQALTPTATCTDMCPEFERMQRGTQNDVWTEEKVRTPPTFGLPAFLLTAE